MSEKSEAKTTIFAVRTTIGRERTVQDLVFNRLRTINPVPDLKAIFTADLYRGFIFIEAIHQRDVVHITSGVPHVKGKVVGSIPFDAVEKVIKPEKVINNIEEGDIVEIITGVFQNKKAQVLKVPKEGGKEEITVRLLDSDSALTVKLSSDSLKLYDKGKKVTTEYVLTKGSQQELSEENEIEVIPLNEEEGDIYNETEGYTSEIEEGSNENEFADSETTEKASKKSKKGKKESKSKSEKETKSEAPPTVLISEEAVTTSLDEKFSFDDDLKDEEFEKEEEIPEKPAKKKKTAKTDEDEDEAEEDDDWAKFF